MRIEGLPLWSRPLPEEPAHGLALRQAGINGLQSAVLAYEQLGLSPTALRRGQGLTALARAVRCPLDAVERDSFHLDADGHTIRVRGVTLNFKQDVDQLRRRACPRCLRASSHHRFWWDVAAISSCPRHGVLLEERCNCDRKGCLSWRDAELWRCQSCRKRPERGDLRALAGTSVAAGIGAMDAYLLGRLGVVERREVAALDRFDFHTTLAVLERVGALHHAGWSRTWKDADDIEGESLASVRATGYRALAEDGLGATLQKAYESFEPSEGVEPNLTTAYGWFYHWHNFRGGVHFSPEITEALLNHASTRFRIDRKAMRDKAVAIGATTMGRIGEYDRQRVTLSEAARTCGRHLLKVRRLAVAYGLVREERMTGRVVMMATADVDVIKILLARMVDRKAVGDMLGISTRAMTAFGDMNLMTPVLDAADDGSRRFGYLVDDALELLELFEATAIPGERYGPCDVVPLLSEAIRPTIGTVVAAVKTRTIHPIRIGGPAAKGLRRFAIARKDVATTANREPVELARPDFEHWRHRIAEIRTAAGGTMPAAPEAAGRGWSRSPSKTRTAEPRRRTRGGAQTVVRGDGVAR